MRSNLQRRGAVYYFRRVVPTDIRHLFPTRSGQPATEWIWSLKTKDCQQAKRLAAQDYEKTSRWVDQARASLTSVRQEAANQPTEEQIVGSHHVESEMMRVSMEAAEFFERLDFEEECRAASDPAFAANLALRAERAAEMSRLRGKREAREMIEQERKVRQLSLLDLFEDFANVEGRSPKTVAQWRPYIKQLVEFVGNPNMHQLTDKQIIRWRNHLRDKVKYRGQPLSPKTINGSYLAAVSTLLSWAKGDGLIDRNPMLEVGKVKAPSKLKLRSKEFTSEEATRILRATLAADAGRSQVEWRNAKRWCPWLMAYSGARVNEITQLRKQDIVEVDEVWVMRLTPEAGTIKTREARMVPLHRDLIDQGFLTFVEGQGSGPLFYDPSKRRSDNAINRQPNRLGSKLAEWVGSLGIEGVKPNHAWRHLFNTLAIEHGLDHRVTLAILGHSAGNVNQSYGSVPVSRLAQEIGKLPRFKIGS